MSSSLIPNLIVNSMHASDVMETIVNGKTVWKKGLEGLGGLGSLDKEKFLAAVKRIGLENLT